MSTETTIHEPPSRVGYLAKLGLPQVTLRATIVGLLIGSVILISNFQFGLQTGWVSMMSLPAALLGFAVFKLTPLSQSFTDVENVYIQSIAVAVGTGPLCYGFVGIIPAIEKFMTSDESGLGRRIIFSTKELIVWSMGLGLFGVFFAIPLRKQVIVKEKLPFPSGSATATLISVLHGTEIYESDMEEEEEDITKNTNGSPLQQQTSTTQLIESTDYSSNMRSLTYTFLVSSAYTLISFFFPILKKVPIFGTSASKDYMWDFQPSPAYIGQGIIMGLPTVSYMLFGAIFGWGILAPLSKYMKWAPGPIDDWVSGGQGWILWVSLSIMVADSLVSFIVLSVKSVQDFIVDYRSRQESYTQALELQQSLINEAENRGSGDGDNNKPILNGGSLEIPKQFLISNKVALIGTLGSTILCVVTIRIIFGKLIPIYASLTAIILAMLFSVLATRTLGVSDINPVSGIGKLSQLIFAFIIPSNHPAKILINLISGGVAEAGAQQAGDLMQDLKTGHLIGASPKAQFIAQIIGTIFSVFLSSIMYQIYMAVYTIPSETFRIPTAVIWIDCSRLVTGEGLPPKAMEFAIVFGVIFAIISLLKNTMPPTSKYYPYLVYLPNGVAVGVGIYNTPNFTLARFIGGLIAYNWHNISNRGKTSMIIFSSGLVLGEGLFSGFTMLLTSLGVKHF
ncbi:Opt8 oligopeptide transporter [Candida orthopsilosis Co 90-125]|uniref:Opt8 oligopeptide transporter n=1 Tax=Candida orthopsilosis (strain 90-125) TaxID=1136231 RepID=H8XBD2_CANO9|nr:Opt8 oligopeptide transporter [Candida orthopsilosis Co 90-125]CCG25381.1 Opt8 oligopeptide transporter [Candida orthopsilosis Co 90-125]